MARLTVSHGIVATDLSLLYGLVSVPSKAFSRSLSA